MYRVYTEKTVDEAVAKGLHELGVTEDDIKIEVIDAGSGGFLGFGKRDAEVKLTIINPELKTYRSIEAMLKETPEQQETGPVAEMQTKEEQEPKEAPVDANIHEEAPETLVTLEPTAAEDAHTVHGPPIINAADDTAHYISRVVHEMNIENDTKISINDTTVTIEFHAERAAKIIGKRGQTLNALQELAQNYFNTIYKSYGTVFLDVEDYRAKRRETLESLAVNMAKKALHTDGPIKMEPMPSFERKTMHHALSRMKDIETSSEGREPNRYVVITKK